MFEIIRKCFGEILRRIGLKTGFKEVNFEVLNLVYVLCLSGKEIESMCSNMEGYTVQNKKS